MKLKLDANGNVVVENGMPVYIHDDGKEIPFDAVAAMTKITSLNGEAKTHREAKEAAEANLAKFSGITDPAKALEALKSGKRVTRAGWNGKGLWLELVQQSPSVDLPYIRLIYPVPGNGAMPYPNGARVPWAPSQTDVLADDWQIL